MTKSYTMTLTLLLLPGLFLRGIGDAHAFEDYEHKAVGDTAIMTIAAYKCAESPKSPPTENEVCSVLLKISSHNHENRRYSYGDIVACVDDFLTPEELMAFLPNFNKGITTHWPDRYKECDSSFSLYFQASHANHAHFQKQLLIAQTSGHINAIALASQQNLEGALLTNAIADHYLQDFFAPGHITTDRAKTTDAVAMAIHNHANREGATFYLDPKYTSKLRDRINEIDSVLNGSSEASQRLCAFLLTGKPSDNTPCNLTKSRLTQILNEKSIRLHGDRFLGDSGNFDQRLLMLAVEMQSIEDILQSYEDNKHPANNSVAFRDGPSYEWTWDTSTSPPNVYARLPFGYYALGSNGQVDPENVNDKELPMGRDLVAGLSVGKEFYNQGQRVSTTSTSMEFLVFGDVLTAGDYGLLVGGYHYEANGGAIGNGGTTRLAYVFPATETTLSLGYRRVYHSGTLQNGWGNGLNVRIDHGLSSMLTFYVSIGKDWTGLRDGSLSFGSYFSAGLMLAGPIRRACAYLITPRCN